MNFLDQKADIGASRPTPSTMSLSGYDVLSRASEEATRHGMKEVYPFQSSDKEQKRLIAQGELVAPLTRRLFERAGITAVMPQRSLNKDALPFRPVQRIGNITSDAILGGLHHHYVPV